MRDTIYLFTWLQEGKSAGHQLASPADKSTKASVLAADAYRLVISCDILPNRSSSKEGKTVRFLG